MDDYDPDIEKDIDNIISQLKNSNYSMKKVEKEQPNLTHEEVDDFILKQASQVISDASQAISDIKDTVSRGGTANDIIAFSELIKAFSSAVDILGKRKIADNKNKTQKEIKQMDIDAKADSGESNPDGIARLELTREEVFKLILSNKNPDKIIDV
jgi:hypothetical protein